MPTKLIPTKERSAQRGDWQTVASKTKIKKKTKLALIVLGLILIVIILGQLTKVFHSLFLPWNYPAGEVQKNWDGQSNINLVLKGKAISVLIFNPFDKKITIIKLPDETYFDLPHMFGKWQLRSIYQLGGKNLLEDSLTLLLGLPIDGILEFQGSLNDLTSEKQVDLFRQNPFNLFTIFPNLKTDLRLWDLIRLKVALSQVRFDKVDTFDLLKLNILDKVQLSDGSEVFTGESAKVDSVISKLADPKIQNEHKTLAIFNATSYPGIAQKAARLITNMGGYVIIITNSESKLKKSLILGENSQTLKRLSQVFGADLKSFSLDSSRAQINLILGEDFYQRF